MNWRALILATLSFAISFAAWGLIGGLASLARLPMGMLTDRFGGRLVFIVRLEVRGDDVYAVGVRAETT